MITVFFALVVFLFVVIFIAQGVVVVRQAETMIIERLGKYHRTLESGLNFVIPIIDTPKAVKWRYVRNVGGEYLPYVKNINRIELRESVYDFPRQNVITSDNVTIEINALLYFQITNPEKSVYEIENLPDAIEKLTQTTLRNVIGGLTLDETFVSRDRVNDQLRLILDDATDKWGVKVNRVELQDIVPPREIRESMEKQMKAERDKRASILTAEGDKQARILNAEGYRDAEISRAEGEKRSKILEAEGEAEAKLKIAEAEAEAIKKITQALGGDTNPGAYLIALKYIDAFKNIATKEGDKTVFMPFETSSILGSLGSIKELFVDKK